MKDEHRHTWEQLGTVDRDDRILVLYQCIHCSRWSSIELDELDQVDIVEGDCPDELFDELVGGRRLIKTYLTPPNPSEVGALSRTRKLLRELGAQTARDLDSHE